jgi:hypothetical protein
VTGEADLRLFMVEHNLGGLSAPQLASAHRALAAAVRREVRRGGQIRYVQRIFVPADGTCLCLFEAHDPDIVRTASDLAQFPLARVVAVTTTMRYGHDLGADDEEGQLR